MRRCEAAVCLGKKVEEPHGEAHTQLRREYSEPAIAMNCIHTRLLIPFAAALLLGACARHPAVTVVNASTVRLDAVVVHGSGFEQPLGSLEPGERRRLKIEPSGETGLGIRFEHPGGAVMHAPQGYFENSGHYSVIGTVTTELGWQVAGELR